MCCSILDYVQISSNFDLVNFSCIMYILPSFTAIPSLSRGNSQQIALRDLVLTKLIVPKVIKRPPTITFVFCKTISFLFVCCCMVQLDNCTCTYFS